MIAFCDLEVIKLGRQGENLASVVEIDATDVFMQFPNAIVAVVAQRHGEENLYVADAWSENGIVKWNVHAGDVAVPGEGRAEIRFIENEVIKKSKTVITYVFPALVGNVGELPEEYNDWIDRITKAGAEAKAYAKQAQDAAEDAIDVATMLMGVRASAVSIPSSSSAYANYNGVGIEFGIPRGEKGAKGDPGKDGITPVKGIDYWTDLDKAEVKDAADSANAMARKAYDAVDKAIGASAIAIDSAGKAENAGIQAQIKANNAERFAEEAKKSAEESANSAAEALTIRSVAEEAQRMANQASNAVVDEAKRAKSEELQLDVRVQKLEKSGGGGTPADYDEVKQRVSDLETGKQDKLIAGSNISIVGNRISATGGGGGTTADYDQVKQRVTTLETDQLRVDGTDSDEIELVEKSDWTQLKNEITDHEERIEVLEQGGGSVPIASATTPGIVKINQSHGVNINANNELYVVQASNANINSRATSIRTIGTANLDYAVKSAMCDGKGAAWTAAEQRAALARLGITVDDNGICHFG